MILEDPAPGPGELTHGMNPMYADSGCGWYAQLSAGQIAF